MSTTANTRQLALDRKRLHRREMAKFRLEEYLDIASELFYEQFSDHTPDSIRVPLLGQMIVALAIDNAGGEVVNLQHEIASQ